MLEQSLCKEWGRFGWDVIRNVNGDIVALKPQEQKESLVEVEYFTTNYREDEPLSLPVNYLIDIKDGYVDFVNPYSGQSIDYNYFETYVEDEKLVLWARRLYIYDLDYDRQDPWDDLSDYWDDFEDKEIFRAIWRNYQEQALEHRKIIEQIQDSKSILSAPYGIEYRWKKMKWEVVRSDKARVKVDIVFDELTNTVLPENTYFTTEETGRFFKPLEQHNITMPDLRRGSRPAGDYVYEVELEALKEGPEYDNIVIEGIMRNIGQSGVEMKEYTHLSHESIAEFIPFDDFETRLVGVDFLLDANYQPLDFRDKFGRRIPHEIIIRNHQIKFVKSGTTEEVDQKYFEKYIENDVLSFWAPRYKLHNRLINDTLAAIIELDETIYNINRYSKMFFDMVKAIWFVYVNGPTIKNLEIGLYVFFGLPITYHDDTEISQINHNGDQIWTTKGDYWQFDENFTPYNFEKDRELREGDVIGNKYTPLVNGPKIKDYMNSPGWWKTENYTEIDKYTYCHINISQKVFSNTVADLSPLSNFFDQVFPLFANPGLTLKIDSLPNERDYMYSDWEPGEPIPIPDESDDDNFEQGGPMIIEGPDGGTTVAYMLFPRERGFNIGYRYHFVEYAPRFNNLGLVRQLIYHREYEHEIITRRRYMDLRKTIDIETLEETLNLIEVDEINPVDGYDFEYEDFVEEFHSLDEDIDRAAYLVGLAGGMPEVEIFEKSSMRELEYGDLGEYNFVDDNIKITVNGEEMPQWQIR